MCLHTFKCFQELLLNSNKSIKYLPFVHTELNDQIVLLQAIQFRMNHLCALILNINVYSLNVKQFYLTHE